MTVGPENITVVAREQSSGPTISGTSRQARSHPARRIGGRCWNARRGSRVARGAVYPPDAHTLRDAFLSARGGVTTASSLNMAQRELDRFLHFEPAIGPTSRR
jgi:hypothetical protein